MADQVFTNQAEVKSFGTVKKKKKKGFDEVEISGIASH